MPRLLQTQISGWDCALVRYRIQRKFVKWAVVCWYDFGVRLRQLKFFDQPPTRGTVITDLMKTLTRSELGAVAILLGEFWLRELTSARVEQLCAADITNALSALDWSLPQVTDGDLEDHLERLQIDYCQLLIGPQGHVSPVESIWIADQFQSQSIDKMKSFFDLLPDYQPPDRFHDHVGVQLDFAGHLLIAADQQTPDELEQADNLLETYVQQCVAWAKPMLEKVHQQAQTSFYRQLTTVTQQWIGFFEPERNS